MEGRGVSGHGIVLGEDGKVAEPWKASQRNFNE